MREERACKARLLRTIEAELLAAVVGGDRLAQALSRPALAPPEERKDEAHLGDDGEDLRQLGPAGAMTAGEGAAARARAVVAGCSPSMSCRVVA